MAGSDTSGTVGLFRSHAEHDRGKPILEVSGLNVRYGGVSALEDISFQLSVGDHVAVVGPNGAGKTTLFKTIAGVTQPSGGEVRIFGTGPGRHICIAYLPQRTQVDWAFPLSVADVVMMGRIGKLGPLRRPRKVDREIVCHCLELVGMRDLAGRLISELSGGQQQRMFIARALAQEAELMIMDEPLTGLDLPAQEEIFRILEVLRSRDVTVMVSTHDLNLATDRFDRVMLLKIRLLGMGRPREIFTTERLAEAYGSHLQVIETEDGMMIFSDTCCKGDASRNE